MAINISPVNDHRAREKGLIVYPTYSRRSQGLSIGINLFPDEKSCTFNCPYCEVFPFSANVNFSIEQMEDDLRKAIVSAQKIPIRDICFSGNGEPTISSAFADAYKSAEDIRRQSVPSAKLVIITNGTGLLQPEVYSLLKDAAANPDTDIWLKLDAGTPQWFQKMNRTALPFDKLMEKIAEFVSCAPVTIQTMLCAIKGRVPSEEEEREWEEFVYALAANSSGHRDSLTCGVRKVQLYGKARASPEDPLAAALPALYLEKRAASLRYRFAVKEIATPVEIYL